MVERNLYLTQSEYMGGPRIMAASWDEALITLEALIAIGECDDDMRLIGRLDEEFEDG